MSGNLFVQSEGLQTFSQSHAGIAQSLPQLAADVAPGGVEGSHGPIAMAANTALSAALGSRGGAVQATTSSAGTISELLQQAARAYERGDLRSAEELRAAADAMADEAGVGGGAGAGGAGAGTGAGPGVGAGAGSGVGAAGAGGGADMMGQMLGQVGGQVGQLAGMAMAPLAGLAQLPQQVMQGVQQAVQAATQAAGMSADADALALDDDVTAAADVEADEAAEPTDEHREAQASERPAGDQAAAGPAAAAGAAPDTAVTDPPRTSAPIRPPTF
ncbi:type VII secretion target [Mycolicibacterium thermoresistibile]